MLSRTLDKMNNSLIQSLEEVGLSNQQSRVYLAMLELGPSSAKQISISSKIHRSSVYIILENLQNLGLVSIEIQGVKKKYVADAPAKLEGMLEVKRNAIQSILPELSALSEMHLGESIIKCFKGIPGIKAAYTDLLEGVKIDDEYLVCSELEKWQAVDPKFFAGFKKKRDDKFLKIKLLVTESSAAHELKKLIVGRGQIKFLPKKTELLTNMVVVPQRVLIHQLGSPSMAMVIFNRAIIKLHQTLFKVIWDSLPESK